ncbi:PD40 domain-containing protein [Nocardioides stalactiti]|uniref:PD40 domain-containing protein n=1 Tax=Nocardioides stalactiti TaxID=2755356 RepID=UPI0015FFA861|nr:PD40 domain-containing protein [Nocardioides stalactiti]
MMRRSVAALLSAGLAAGFTAGSGGARATVADPPLQQVVSLPGVNDRIAYTKQWTVRDTPGPDDRQDVFSVRPNGEGGKRLTFFRDAGEPKWSPNGRRIAFERPGEVWVVRADGEKPQLLTEGELVGWMPTGGQVLVARGLANFSGSADPTWVLHTLATGAEEVLPIDLPIEPGLEPPYDGEEDGWTFAATPALSPDGELLALTLQRYDGADDGYAYWFGSFFTVRLDGTELSQVGDAYTYSFGGLTWSPDGDEIAYWSSEPRAHCFGGLGSMLLDGSPGTLNVDQGCPEDPVWSPDGRKVAYSTGTRIKLANINGTRAKTVVGGTGGAYYFDPDWRRKP